MSETIQRIVFGTLLSLSILGIVNTAVDTLSEKSPWETKKAKRIMLIVILIVSLIGLFWHNRKKSHRKKKSLLVKTSLLQGSKSINPNNVAV